MKLDESTIDKIAHLARLEVKPEEKNELIAEMNKILTFMEKLNELDTSAVEPLIYMNNEVNVLRKDEIKTLITHEEALQNAPKSDSEYFRVAKVIE